MTDQHVQMLFSTIDMSSGWISRPGRDGVSEKILCGSLEDFYPAGAHGSLNLRQEPGAPQQEHVHWEESYLISGDLEIIDEEGVPVVRFDAPAYVCRPPKKAYMDLPRLSMDASSPFTLNILPSHTAMSR